MNTDPHATEPSFAKPPVGVPMPAVPIIVAVMGLPGAGKSIAARALEEHLGLRRICRDTIRAAMFPGGGDSFIEKRAAWRSLLLGLEINCMLGIGSVIDGATFSRRKELERVAAIGARHRIVTIPLFVDCPPDIARERVARDFATRSHVARDRTPDLVNDVLARREPPPPEALRIDGSLAAGALRRAAVAAVRESIAAAVASGDAQG
ncbi:MAG TPA: AAA family ATPase [Dokdonella sp.]|uniref:AAA family ATPase n=1 Tax=Dokdonella sp. TaxID=2291710 RepID=UPI0025C04D06|nr:AAA family ATPase [Dokdonella sp.]MBX3692867.1 ATP-binding protein [Dokdonella sp.]HNR91939.1 AAA family ATPase [Dokdonella sp.]